MKRVLLFAVLLAMLLPLASLLPRFVQAQGAGSRVTITFLPRAGDPAAGTFCTAAAGCTANWAMYQSDPGTATAVYTVTNGLCEVSSTQGGTQPATFDVFIQSCPNGNCSLTTGDWDDYARFTLGSCGPSPCTGRHVIGWTNAAQLHGHTLCTSSTAVTAGACAANVATCGIQCATANCLPPDCVRGFYWGDRVRITSVLTGGDGTTTESITLKCFQTATQ